MISLEIAVATARYHRPVEEFASRDCTAT